MQMLICLGILSVVILYLVPQYKRWVHDRSHAIGYTQQSLRKVELAILAYCELGKRPLMSGGSNAVMTYNGSELYSVLAQSEDALFVLNPDDLWKARKTVCDAWGEEIHMQINTSNKVIIWSKGPNRIDEKQQGDDLSTEFVLKGL